MSNLKPSSAKPVTTLSVFPASILAVFMFLAFAITPVSAQTFNTTTLVNFDLSNGANSGATLVQAPDGELYGTTYSGGGVGKGTIFRLAPTGAFVTVHSFNGADGQNPFGGLVLAAQGGLIGTTYVGGAYGQDLNGYGTVYRMTTSEFFATVQSFAGTNGQNPEDALTLGNDGNYYGTTRLGGANGDGAVVKVTPGGTITILHSFDDVTDGEWPIGGLTLGADGNFYGTTYSGGANLAGTVFKVSPSGTFTTLHAFSGTDGSGSVAPLVLGTDGNLYGTTGAGGDYGYGVVFRITPSGSLTVLHVFYGYDGIGPGALAMGNDGSFYVMTSNGGGSNDGTILKITQAGAASLLSFFNGTNGANPYGGLVQHTNGVFYGVTYAGGSNGYGTVFSLNLGLPPFVGLQTPFAKVGGTIGILGQGFRSATAVSINGTPASFKIISDTYLIAVVPAQSASGYVKVKTPTGVLTSNRRLQVK